jgi:hypothetical protein
MRYHEASGLFGFAAARDWSTAEGAADGLRQLELEDYGAAFRLYRGQVPLGEEEARQAVVGMLDRGLMDRNLDAARRMLGAGDNPRDLAVLARPDGSGGLYLEHGDFKETLDLGAAGLRLAEPAKPRSKERSKAIERKHLDTRGTSEGDYLLHAEQCGFLLRNARLDFLRSPRMQGTSVKMRIPNLTMDDLRQFTDAAGRRSLAGLSTHEGTDVDSEGAIHSGWIGFPLAVVDFLNLEGAIDVEDLKAQHHAAGYLAFPGGDTGFRPLSDWGVGPESVIGELAYRRPNIDADKIRERFMAGYGGELSQ